MSVRRIFTTTCLLLAGAAAFGANAQDLLINLKEGTRVKQHEAALQLSDFVDRATRKGFPEVVSALSAKLDDVKADTHVRAACAQSLGKLNDLSVYSMIETLAKKKDEKGLVRAACVGAMSALKGTAVIGELAMMLRTEKANIVARALERSLIEMPDKNRVTVAVAPLLKEADSAPSAIRIMGNVGGPGVVGPLAQELKSPTARIRMAVITALGNIHVAEAAMHLINYYPKANPAEKTRVLAALGKHPHPAGVKLLMDELNNQKAYPALRRRAALSLGTLKVPFAIKPLVNIMLKTSEHRGLRLTCVQALANFTDRNDDAIAGLIGALADDKLKSPAALALNRITRRYFGTNQEKWTDWFQHWRRTRDRRRFPGH